MAPITDFANRGMDSNVADTFYRAGEKSVQEYVEKALGAIIDNFSNENESTKSLVSNVEFQVKDYYENLDARIKELADKMHSKMMATFDVMSLTINEQADKIKSLESLLEARTKTLAENQAVLDANVKSFTMFVKQLDPARWMSELVTAVKSMPTPKVENQVNNTMMIPEMEEHKTFEYDQVTGMPTGCKSLRTVKKNGPTN